MSQGISSKSSDLQSRDQVRRLVTVAPSVLPSLLQCDFGNLEAEIKRLEAAGVDALHLDIMDGHFVPNMTYGLTIVEALRKLTSLPIDAHLMISNPGDYVERYVAAGADLVTIHVEAVDDPGPLLQKIRDLGAASGLAFNPSTTLEAITPHIELCDLILVMSVKPGFGGQKFDETALEKLSALKKIRPEGLLLQVDGGVNDDTIAACSEAGADLLVVGSGLFAYTDYSERIQHLTGLAQSSRSDLENKL